MEIIVTSIVHEYGTTFFAHKTKEGALRALAEWCRAFSGGGEFSRSALVLPDDDEEAIQAYFEDQPEEWSDQETVELED